MPDDIERDPVLQRHLVLLSTHATPTRDFTDRVVADLAHQGLVRRSSITEPRWLAAAAAIFALGLGVGTVVTAQRSRAVVQPLSPVVVDRIAAEINVPSPGKSEVWF